MKKLFLILIVLFIISGCGNNSDSTTTDTNDVEEYPNAKVINLDTDKATIDNQEIKEYDYTLTIDPDSTEEIYSGQEPEGNIYIAHDIIYYPEVDEDSFELVNYDGEREWATHYTAEEATDYYFGLLPSQGSELPTQMMHSKLEAYSNPVLHINEAGEYILQGNFNGQIAIDLGEDSFTDEDCKVTIILNGANVTCSVAPAFIVYNAYEVDNAWEEAETHSNEVDLTNAGVKIILVDGTENNFIGANVYRLLKAEYKKDSTEVQKKRYKYDAAFYSCVSMLIDSESKGTGILNVTSTTFEGLDTELHLTINNGYINIYSQDDGINVNEDDVSVFTMNGGHLTIFAGQGAEGDVIDSNGYIKVNGGILAGTSPSSMDDILDSNNGAEVSDDAKIYSGGNAKTDINSGPMTPPGGFGGGQPPEGFNFEEMGQPPEGFGERPEMPQGNMPN
ncbi:MAG: carbohydrate-binding domain-containing protein [Erysipelotrichaceae bacterium]|nr:carbohydrate-binding domain-containing protein [Erysipelotrichaceae bacterium]